MSELEKTAGDGELQGKKDCASLIERVNRERWDIPRSVRGPLLERLHEIVHDPAASHRDVLSAASAILSASKINLANINMTMKVREYAELEERITKLERGIEADTHGHGQGEGYVGA